MAITKARLAAQKRYKAKKLDNVTFDVPKGMRAMYKSAAQDCGLSLMGMIRRAVEEFIKTHTGKTFPKEELTVKQKLLAERFSKLPPETQQIVFSLVCNAEKVANKGAAGARELTVMIQTPIEEFPEKHTVDKAVALLEEPVAEEPTEAEELSAQEQLLLTCFGGLPQKTKELVLNLVGEAARVANKGAAENGGGFAPLRKPAGTELSKQEQLLLARFDRLPQKTKDVVLENVDEAARVANRGAD